MAVECIQTPPITHNTRHVFEAASFELRVFPDRPRPSHVLGFCVRSSEFFYRVRQTCSLSNSPVPPPRQNIDTMNQTDFLIAHPETRGGKSRPFVIGESGFSFGNRERPATTRDTWLNSDGIPAAARDVLTRHPQFMDIVGLVGVPGRT